MIRIAICDDEKKILDEISGYIKNYAEKKNDDAFTHTNHICRHADTAFSVCHQRIKQVLRDLQIFFRCDLRLPCKKYRIVHQFFNHYFLHIRILHNPMCIALDS